MAKKQDIDAGKAFNMAGAIPGGHALAPIRAGLLESPRERRWVIGQVVSSSTRVDHPDDADDTTAPTIKFVDMAAITEPAEADQLAAMLARAHATQPGQATLDEVSPGPEGKTA